MYIYILYIYNFFIKQTNKFWVRAMEFELFQSKFCAVTVALRRKGNDHFLWSWKLLQGGSLLLASLGHLLTMRCHPMSEYRISVLFRTSQVSGTSSPSLDQEELVSWKPWLMQCPERTRPFFNLLDQNKVECASKFNIQNHKEGNHHPPSLHHPTPQKNSLLKWKWKWKGSLNR